MNGDLDDQDQLQQNTNNDTDNIDDSENENTDVNENNNDSEYDIEPQVYTSENGVTLVLDQPIDLESITCPINIEGQIENDGWFFESEFSIELVSILGQTVSTTQARAVGDWMTSGNVEFTTELPCSEAELIGSSLVFKNNNASGLPENDDSITIELLNL